jgi:hypothetical protein
MKSVQDILDDLNRDSAPVTKTASVAPDNDSVETARANLQASLGTLLQPGQAKVASAGEGNVPQYLEKVAHDLAQADEIATIKEARLYGGAVFDGFIARANQYAGPASTKTAADAANTTAHAGYSAMDRKLHQIASQTKLAAAQEDAMLKTAATEGYNAMDRKLQELSGGEVKTAAQKQAEYNDGVLAGLDKVAEHSIDCFERGFEHMNNIAQQLAS